jgi:hypothetical protein
MYDKISSTYNKENKLKKFKIFILKILIIDKITK